jgi:NCAIR mutase (PurE)-related protein
MSDRPEALRQLLDQVAAGHTSAAAAFAQLQNLAFEPVEDFAKLDRHRALRTGFPETIWGPGKTPEQIAKIFLTLQARSPVVMATRIEPAVFEQVRSLSPELAQNLVYYDRARICALQAPAALRQSPHPGTIGLVSAGTADLPVAEEAAVTAELSGFRVERLWDVGVSGIHRLLAHRDRLRHYTVVIVVAGMEGALPSVVAGLVDCPTIAVPTSIGYGANFNGLAPLLTMLNSCAAGIGVVNIDNGFGAAILAGQMLRAATKLAQTSPPVDPTSP